MTDKLSSSLKLSPPFLLISPPPSFLFLVSPPPPPNLFPILCEEHIDVTRTVVSTKVHPTTHSVSSCACWTKRSTPTTPVVQIPIISMVTTAVLVPTWHAVHGIGTLTHLCVSGDVVVCDGCVCDRKRYVHVVWFVEGCMHHKWLGEIATL